MQKTPLKRLTSMGMAAVMILGLATFTSQKTAQAAITNETTVKGEANDGIDFSDTTGLLKQGTGIYLGKYKHATALHNSGFRSDTDVRSYHGEPDTWETDPTPIQWEVMGEETINGTADENITLLSKYAIDSKPFNANWRDGHSWFGSDIQEWLNGTTATDFLYDDNFQLSEKDNTLMPETTIYTRMYSWDYGDLKTGNYSGMGIDYDSDGTPGKGKKSSQQMYLPWGAGTWRDNKHSKVGWDITADKESSYILTNTQKKTQLKAQAEANSSDGVSMWLRSPASIASNGAMSMFGDGSMSLDDVSHALGVRPAFKLNPQSVIFTSEIKSSSDATGKSHITVAENGYAASADDTNFKLTVVDNTLNLAGLRHGTDNITSSAHPTVTVEPTGEITLTGIANTITGTTINYKIVQEDTGTNVRSIVGYGIGTNSITNATSENNIEIKPLKLDGTTPLADGDYTVYVWLQKNNAVNSHEGSTPLYFNMTVKDKTAFSPLNNATNVATGAALTITFNKAVEIDNGAIKIFKKSNATMAYEITTPSALTSISPTSELNTTYTITPSPALEAGTTYYVTIDNTFFKNASGNYYAGIDNNSAWTFTTIGGGYNPGGGSSSGGRSSSPTVIPPPTQMADYDKIITDQLKAGSAPAITLAGNETTATLKGTTLIAVMDSGKPLTITKGNLTMMLTPELIKSLNLKASDAIAISITPTTAQVLDSIKNMDTVNTDLLAKVYDVTFKINGSAVTTFDQPIIFTFDAVFAKLTDPQKAKLTGVSFLTDSKTKQLGGKVSGEKITFTTTSFSKYGVIISDTLVKIVTTIGSTTYMRNGAKKTTDVAPVIMDSRAMVPVRFIAESLGAEVSWVQDTQTVGIKLDGENLTFRIGQKSAGMDVAPVVVDGRTLVPLRYVSEKLGANVLWNEATRSIDICR